MTIMLIDPSECLVPVQLLYLICFLNFRKDKPRQVDKNWSDKVFYMDGIFKSWHHIDMAFSMSASCLKSHGKILCV